MAASKMLAVSNQDVSQYLRCFRLLAGSTNQILVYISVCTSNRVTRDKTVI